MLCSHLWRNSIELLSWLSYSLLFVRIELFFRLHSDLGVLGEDGFLVVRLAVKNSVRLSVVV